MLGPVTIGANTKIGAGSVVTQDLPPNVTAVGSPVMIVRKDGRADSAGCPRTADRAYKEKSNLIRRKGMFFRKKERKYSKNRIFVLYYFDRLGRRKGEFP